MTPEENDFQIGLQTSADVRKFRASKIGKEIIEDVLRKEDELREKIYVSMEQARQEELLLAQIASFTEKDKDKPEHPEIDESVFEKHRKQQQRAVDRLPHAEAPTRYNTDTYEEILKDYDTLIHSLETKKENTKQQYVSYDESLGKSDQFIDGLDPNDKAGSKTSLLERIKELKAVHDRGAEQAMAHADAGNIPEAQAGLARVRAQGLEIVQLNEMLSVINDEKVMYKKDGTLANTFAEADFLVKKEQQLIKEGDNYYLLDNVDKDGNKMELNDSNREAAKQAFERAQSGMINLKDLIKNNKSIDMAQIEDELQNARAERSQHISQQAAPQSPVMTALSDTGIKPSQHVEATHLDLGGTSDKTATSTSSEPELNESNKQRSRI